MVACRGYEVDLLSQLIIQGLFGAYLKAYREFEGVCCEGSPIQPMISASNSPSFLDNLGDRPGPNS